MTFTELSLPKKIPLDFHNTVAFRNYSHFEECEFINDIQSNDFLNGCCGEVRWGDWKYAFLTVSDKHAPIKTSRLKVRSNPFVKLMYKIDKIHELAVKRNDDTLMNEYRSLRNTVAHMIKNRKRNLLLMSVIHHVQIRVNFGRNLVLLYPKSLLNQFQEISVLKILTYILKTSLTWSVPQLQETVHYCGRDRKVYIYIYIHIYIYIYIYIYAFKFTNVQRNELTTLLLSCWQDRHEYLRIWSETCQNCYLSDRVVMNFDVNGCDTRGSDMELNPQTLREDMYQNSFMYKGGKLWNDLPEFVQHSMNIESLKQNYKMYKLIINSWLFLQFVYFCIK